MEIGLFADHDICLLCFVSKIYPSLLPLYLLCGDSVLSQRNHLKPKLEDMSKKCTIEYDGSSKGNPGRAGAGAVLRDKDGVVIGRYGKGLGTATNNEAEYRAVMLGMEMARERGYDSVHVKGDSQLVTKQMQGEWQTRNPNIQRLHGEAIALKNQFKEFKMDHVPRGYNSAADAEANKAADYPRGYVYED